MSRAHMRRRTVRLARDCMATIMDDDTYDAPPELHTAYRLICEDLARVAAERLDLPGPHQRQIRRSVVRQAVDCMRVCMDDVSYYDAHSPYHDIHTAYRLLAEELRRVDEANGVARGQGADHD